MIEGSFGLGEAVVSGSVSPDRYVVRKDPLSVWRREVDRKERTIEYDAEGGTRNVNPLARGGSATNAG